MIYVGKIHKKEFADVIVLTFMSLKFHLDLEKSTFLNSCFAYPFIVNG